MASAWFAGGLGESVFECGLEDSRKRAEFWKPILSEGREIGLSGGCLQRSQVNPEGRLILDDGEAEPVPGLLPLVSSVFSMKQCHKL